MKRFFFCMLVAFMSVTAFGQKAIDVINAAKNAASAQYMEFGKEQITTFLAPMLKNNLPEGIKASDVDEILSHVTGMKNVMLDESEVATLQPSLNTLVENGYETLDNKAYLLKQDGTCTEILIVAKGFMGKGLIGLVNCNLTEEQVKSFSKLAPM